MSSELCSIQRTDTSYWLSHEEQGDLDLFYSDGKGDLPAEESRRLIQDLVDGMPGYGPAQYFAAQPGIFNKYEHLLIAKTRHDGCLKGLLGARWFEDRDFRFLYLWTGFVTTNTQKRGLTTNLFGHLMSTILKQHPIPRVIAAKTFSPIWYKVMSKITASIPGAILYPAIGAEQMPDMIEMAEKVHRQVTPTLAMEFDVGIIRGAQAAIGRDFFPIERPLSGTAELDNFFVSNVSRDDQVLTFIDLSSVDQQTIVNAIDAMKAKSADIK
jgi:hypothetical protein